MITQEELLAWHAEVDADRTTKMDKLSERIREENPLDFGLHLGRCELSAEIGALDAVSICLGQVIRGKRLE